MRQVWPTSVATTALPEAIASSKLESAQVLVALAGDEDEGAGEEGGQVCGVAPLHHPVQGQPAQAGARLRAPLPSPIKAKRAPGCASRTWAMASR